MSGRRICLGVVVGAHGLGGAVRVKCFTERPADIATYGPLWDEAGTRQFALRVLSETKGVATAKIEGISSRDAAEALKGLRFMLDRDALPEPDEEEYYAADLVGLRAEGNDGRAYGTVAGLYDFGGGDILEIKGPEGAMLVPFTKAAVPVVDVNGGRIVIDPPAEVEMERAAQSGGPDGE